MEQFFKLRSSEFVEDDIWTKKCVAEFMNAPSATLDRKSKRDVCFFEIDASPSLFKIVRKQESGRIVLSAECPGNFMFAWALLSKEKTGSENPQLAFDPLVVVNSKVSSTSGDIRSIKQHLHGVLTTKETQNVIELNAIGLQRQSKIIEAMGPDIFDEVVDLIHKGNFVYLCQRNNFQLNPDHFAQVEDRFVEDSFVDPIVVLKQVEGMSFEETSNNIEVELLKLFDKPLFRDLMEHIADLHDLDESCLQYHVTTNEDGELVDATCVSLELLRHLARFTRDVSEAKKSIIADVKKTKIVLEIFRYFNDSDSTQTDGPVMFRMKVDRNCNNQKE